MFVNKQSDGCFKIKDYSLKLFISAQGHIYLNFNIMLFFFKACNFQQYVSLQTYNFQKVRKKRIYIKELFYCFTVYYTTALLRICCAIKKLQLNYLRADSKTFCRWNPRTFWLRMRLKNYGGAI